MTFTDALLFLKAVYGAAFTPATDETRRATMAAIAAAEARLGITLPATLRALYVETGQVEALHQRHNRLLPLAQIDVAGEYVVFYEENQGVVVWGVAKAALASGALVDDLPVAQGYEDATMPGGWAFHSEFASVAEFMCAQGAWQAVQGGLPFVGAMHKAADELGWDSDAAPDFVSDGLRAWLVADGVAIAAGDTYVGLATHHADTFAAASERGGIDVDCWSYATVTDDE